MSALRFTPAQRDALTCVFALALLTAPLWSLPLGFGEQIHEYERAEVTVNGSTIEYAPASGDLPDHVPISHEIACSSAYTDTRVCAFESYLAANHSIPTEWRTTARTATYTSLPGDQRYRYVRVDGQIYEATYRTNVSGATNESGDDMARIYLAQKPVDPHRTLEAVSVEADAVAPTIRRAARTGSANHTGPVEVPETLVRIDGGFYRVYEASVSDQSPLAGFFGVLLRFIAPVVGLGLLVSLRGRFRLQHVSQIDGNEE